MRFIVPRIGFSQRSLSTTCPSLALAQREYPGDPGPSTRKTEELRVRSSIRSGRQGTTLNDRDILDGFLDASSPEPFRQRPYGAERPKLLPGRAHRDAPSRQTFGQSRTRPQVRPRFDPTSKNFYNPRPLPPSTVLEPNPYDTSRQLREWIRAHPSPINHSSMDEAVGIVLGAEKGAVNAVVWNMLLGLIGREGSLERMWKLYNDVSGQVYDICD